MSSIEKLCAEHLRAFSNNYGVKLKSEHAHELIAAFLGYKSKAAMQSDTFCPIKNFKRAQIFVLIPSIFIEQRRESLADLPSNLPDSYILREELFAYLETEEILSGRFFPSWGHLTEELIKEYLQKNGDLILSLNLGLYEKSHNIFNKPVYEFNPKIETTNNEIKLTVSSRYYGSSDVHFQPIDIAVTIALQRIAGHVGYTQPEISIKDVSSATV